METIILTYKELAEKLCIKPQSARKLAQRKKWLRSSGNDGAARVHVPTEAIPLPCDNSRDDTRDITSDEAQSSSALEIEIALLKTELKYLNEKNQFIEKQNVELKTDRDAWKNQANAWQEQAQSLISKKKRNWWFWK